MRISKVLAWATAFALTVSLGGTAGAQFNVGPFEITGFYQFTVDTPTEHANPNNSSCLSFIVGAFQCSPGLQKKGGKPDLLLMRQLLDLSVLEMFAAREHAA